MSGQFFSRTKADRVEGIRQAHVFRTTGTLLGAVLLMLVASCSYNVPPAVPEYTMYIEAEAEEWWPGPDSLGWTMLHQLGYKEDWYIRAYVHATEKKNRDNITDERVYEYISRYANMQGSYSRNSILLELGTRLSGSFIRLKLNRWEGVYNLTEDQLIQTSFDGTSVPSTATIQDSMEVQGVWYHSVLHFEMAPSISTVREVSFAKGVGLLSWESEAYGRWERLP